MKFVIIPYIALGFVLSLAIGIEYNCKGQEMFPTYYGSPFVFKQKSLGSSMEYFYSISGLILNVLTWSVVLYFLDKGIQRFNKKKPIRVWYKFILGLLIVFTTLNVAVDSKMLGRGFNENLNYWYWNLANEAKIWEVKCEGELIILMK
jgi:hypothetical protein